jgi:hypothetical protein
MKLFIVLMLAFLLAGCESRSIHSTYLTMKADIPWLQSFCRGSPLPPEISYKGSSVYISLYCTMTSPSTEWISQVSIALREKGWINEQDDEQTFCHPVTGVKIWLPLRSTSQGLTRQAMSMRFPDRICSKYRPNPYQPLPSEKTLSQSESDQ